MTYSTKAKAVAALVSRGFELRAQSIMGAAPWVKGSAYAWISEVYSPRHGKVRHQVNVAG